MITHFKNIGLENFRVFKEKTEFDFAPITILTGTNSSGKSSLINAMEMYEKSASLQNNPSRIDRLLGNSIDKKLKFNNFSISPSYLNKRFGNFKGLLNSDVKDDVITFSMNGIFDYSNAEFTIDFKYKELDNDAIGYLTGVFIYDKNSKELLFSMDAKSETLKKERAGSLYINYAYWFSELKKYASKDYPEPIGNQDDLITNDSIKHEPAIASDYLRTKLLKEYLKNGNPLYVLMLMSTHFDGEGEEELKMDSPSLEFAKSEYNQIRKQFKIPKLDAAFRYKAEMDVLFDFQTSFNCKGEINFSNISTCFKTLVNPLFNFTNWDVSEEKKNASFIWKVNTAKHLRFQIDENQRDVSSFIFNYFIGNNIINAFNTGCLPQFQFLDSTKADVQRLYLDYQANSDDFVKQITLVSRIFAKADKSPYSVKEFLNICIKELSIGESLSFKKGVDGSSSSMVIVANGKERNVADMGYGVSQVLSFLFGIAICADLIVEKYRDSQAKYCMSLEEFCGEDFGPLVKIIIVEEPEANLHPANQSKLADIIVYAAAAYGIQFIIETHSEYLIRKLQYLTAKGQIKPEDTQIYYFHPPDDVPPGDDQVKKINIEEDGTLTNDFGTGFFDESDKIAMSIWNMNRSQKN